MALSAAVAASPSLGADSVTGLARRERVRSFELAGGLSVLFMIGVHVLWHWGAPDTWTTPVGLVISNLGGPTATPVFVFLMGASLARPGTTGFGRLAARGAWLFVLGYVLDILRGFLPATLGLATGVTTLDRIYPFTPWWLLTTVDLHHMTGLTLIAVAALRRRGPPGISWLALAGVLVFVAPHLRDLTFGTPWLDAPLTPILGSAPNVYYAVVPWLAYALAGAYFGSLMQRVRDQQAAFRVAALVGLVLLVVGGLLILRFNPGFDVATYWRQPPPLFIAVLGVVLVWLAVCDAVTRIPWLDAHLGIVYGWSRRVIPMYFTHWILIGWGAGLVGFRALSLPQVLVAIVVAAVLTSRLSAIAARLEAGPALLRHALEHDVGRHDLIRPVYELEPERVPIPGEAA
jgi:uncharacterized membrane protein